jgi:hypothetical protein
MIREDKEAVPGTVSAADFQPSHQGGRCEAGVPATSSNWEDEWSQTWGLCNLTQFVVRALEGALKWAPYAARAYAECEISVRCFPLGSV